MPIYEYRCRGCRKRVSILTLRVSEAPEEVCSHCGGTDLERLMSRFAMPRGEQRRLDDLADPSRFGDVDESDPRSVARWMRRVGSDLGDDVGSADLDEMVDAIDSGADDVGSESSGADDEG